MRSRLAFVVLIFAAAAFAASLIFSFPSLPERPATHFGGSGEANGWMTRDQHVWGITVLGFGLPALVIGICYSLRFLPSSMLNVPRASYWRAAAHYPEACRILLGWSFWFGAIHFVWTGVLNDQLVLANRVSPPFLAPIPVLVLSGFYLLATGVSIGVLILQFAKAPTG